MRFCITNPAPPPLPRRQDLGAVAGLRRRSYSGLGPAGPLGPAVQRERGAAVSQPISPLALECLWSRISRFYHEGGGRARDAASPRNRHSLVRTSVHACSVAGASGPPLEKVSCGVSSLVQHGVVSIGKRTNLATSLLFNTDTGGWGGCFACIK